MTPLRKKFIEHMVLRNLAPSTQTVYVKFVAALAKFYNLSPDKINNDQIQAYLIHLISERKLSWSTGNTAFSAFRLFYQQILKRDASTFSLPSRKTKSRLPEILSPQEVKRLIDAAGNQKHRTLLLTTYLTGLRADEAVHLKVEDIDSERMVIRVQQGKGNKDRYTLLLPELLEALRAYWKIYRPSLWLFPARGTNQPLTAGAALRIFKKAREKAGLSKGRGIHTLRHCFATHLLEEENIDLHRLQKLLGHATLRSTSIYLHLSSKGLTSVGESLGQPYRADAV